MSSTQHVSPPSSGHPASDAIRRVSTIPVEDHDLSSVLDQVATGVRETIPVADAVSVTHIDGSEPKTVASTDELATVADYKQYELDTGPCLDCARTNEPQIVNDLSAETRWPDYVPFALDQGVRSSLSIPLPVRDQVLGAISIYSRQRHEFSEDEARDAVAFAAHAAVAIANVTAFSTTAYLAKNLELSLASRAPIEQAKGMVMMRMGCGPQEAFDLLRQLSQRTNRKLREIALDVVERRIEL